ncbi:MAG: hypothetical protein ACTS27_07360 [Phycisphaerales bacterium]
MPTPTADPSSTPTTRPPGPKRKGPVRRVLDLFSSVWLGIWLLTALFIYMSIGSALYQVRQLRVFEMSEFEWFNWWPFTLMVALLCINLVVATVRRIRLTPITLGVWMIHAGIIIMSLGSVYYFATKVEGDTPVFRRLVSISAPDHETVSMPALPNASVDVVTTDGVPVRYTVAQTDPRWPLLSGDDKGKEVYSVSVLVQRGQDAIDTPPFATTPEGETLDAQSASARPFIRQLFVGYPQYTEDVIPGLGRAKNAVGETILDDDLTMTLRHDPQEWFHIVHTWALYTRPVDAEGNPLADWTQRALPSAGAGTAGRMPRYNDYLVDRDEVWLPPGLEDMPLDPLRVRAQAAPEGDPLADVDLTVTGYLRYAPDESRRVAGDHGSAPLWPFATVQLSGRGMSAYYTLEAFDPQKNNQQSGNLVFRWLEPGEDVSSIGRGQPAKILVRIPEADAETTLTLDGSVAVGADAPFRAIEGADGWAVRVKGLIDDLPIGEDFRASFADVEFRAPSGEVIRRWIADDPSVTNDIALNPDDPSQESRVAPDPRVRTLYAPPVFPPAITLVGSHDNEHELLAVLGVFGGDPQVIPLTTGSGVTVGEGITLDLLDFSAHSELVTKPRLIPEQQRDRDLGVALAQARVRVEAPGLDRPVAVWTPFTQNLLPSADYTYGGRFPAFNRFIDLPDGRRMELIFSRERRKLPSPVVLDDFVLHEHVGGFTGDTAAIRDWESVLRFVSDDGALGEPVAIRTNEPGEHAGFRFFQAMWDPPAGPQTGSPSAGLNFTGLGIGNRNGVFIMLFGGTLSVVGSIYAFYVKPVLKRRRAAKVRAEIEAGAHGEAARTRAVQAERSLEHKPLEDPALIASEEIAR